MSRASSVGQQLRSLVRKAGVLVGTRTYLNFVEGANTTITIADDSANDEVTVTIASTASGGAAVADGPGANDTIDTAGAAGVSASAARVDHGHRLNTYGTAGAAVGTAAAGTSGTAPSRGDHVHSTGAGTPSTQAFGDAAAVGTGPAASMTDHKHAMPANPAWVGPAVVTTVETNTMAGNVNDFAIAATTTVLRMSPNGGNRQLTGIVAGVDGRVILLINPDSANTVTLMHDVTSTAANRFYCPKGVDVVLRHREGVWLEYDGTNTRWHVLHGAMPEAGPDADVTVGATGAAGTAGQFSRAGHGHKLTNSTATPANIGTAAAGTSTNAPLPDNHVHATGAGTPSTQAFGDAAATGSGPAAAMTDHKHAMPSNVTGPNLSMTPGVRPNVNGLLNWTEDNLMHSSNKTPAAATIYLRKIMVPVTMLFTNLLIVESTAGTSYTNAQLGLYSSAGVLLGSSAVQASAGTNGFGAAAPAVVTLPLTVVGGQSLTVTGGDAVFVWAAVHMGTNSATSATFVGSATGVAMTNLGQAVSLSRAGTIAGHATNNLATIGNITPGSISQSAPLNIWFGVT